MPLFCHNPTHWELSLSCPGIPVSDSQNVFVCWLVGWFSTCKLKETYKSWESSGFCFSSLQPMSALAPLLSPALEGAARRSLIPGDLAFPEAARMSRCWTAGAGAGPGGGGGNGSTQAC